MGILRKFQKVILIFLRRKVPGQTGARMVLWTRRKVEGFPKCYGVVKLPIYLYQYFLYSDFGDKSRLG
jgi:hypothetical protein